MIKTTALDMLTKFAGRWKTRSVTDQRGFSLIELLLVISIIGILAGLVLTATGNARLNARDAQRLSDLKQIRTALELYYDDKGVYPPSPCGYNCWGWAISNNTSWQVLAGQLSQYIKLPVDPINGNSSTYPWITGHYLYAYGMAANGSNGDTYDLVTQLENTGDPRRCEVKLYLWKWNTWAWCGSPPGFKFPNNNSKQSKYLYDVSP